MITLVVGGQYGSEGKGSFCHWYGEKQGIEVWARAGGPQAGHSVMIGGTVIKLRQLPVGALIEGTVSVIGPGAVINPDLLAKEILNCEALTGHYPIVVVDPDATVLEDNDSNAEHTIGLVERIGSTGEGVGYARSNRIMRIAPLMKDVPEAGWNLEKAGPYLQRITTDILIEGTQGAALSLFSGYYPYVTSWSTHPAQLLADTEIWPGQETQVLALYRTFPIRVGGNSGPMHKELDWETLQARHGDHIPIETTTVTGRERRVGEWDLELAEWSVEYLNPDLCVLSFLDYPFPEIARQVEGTLPMAVVRFIQERANDLGRDIRYVGTGFGTYLSKWEGGW